MLHQLKSELEYVRILLVSAVPRAIPLEILNQSVGMMSKIAEVYRLAANFQEEKTIEDFEQFSTGLMDRTQDSLTSFIGELSEEGYNGPCALGVQTGSWLVEEKEKTRLGDELDSNGGTLPHFDVQSTDDGVSVFLQTTELQAPLNVGFLLRKRHRCGLTHLRREEQCLPDSLSGEMGILLLTISATTTM